MINDIEHCAIIKQFEDLCKSDSKRKRIEKEKRNIKQHFARKINQIINQFLGKGK